MGAKVIQVIRTFLEHRGKGIEGDESRIITQYWSFDGELLWEIDPIDKMRENERRLEEQKVPSS